MKKITLERANELLKMGIYPKCEVSRGIRRPIKSLADLEHFKNLSKVQGFELFGYDNSIIQKFKIPNNALDVNIDEASQMIMSGEQIYGRRIEEDEITLSSLSELLDFYRKVNNSGDSFLLYWKCK